MQLRLHANATTTPRTRAYIQNSTASPAALARELGIHPRTVARWKTRPDVADRSTRPHRLATAIQRMGRSLDRRAAPEPGAAARRHRRGGAAKFTRGGRK
jgi:hypothetical protein